ncbi:MAG TPA: AAA family ATPase [Candidatus Binatia bacterium]|jgi:general secretion pathway protein A|nr:AAA family ATPase [Candidatus Binatia bacterium]
MYERFFGLVDAPFRLTPDPRYLYLSAKHADALAHLRLGLSESSGFVCITGDVGTGKTTVLRHFLTDLAPEVSSAYVINPTLTALELLQTINAELGLPSSSTSRKALVDDLNRHLLAERQVGRCAVVVVDEAQALAIDVLEQLRLLSNLETTTEKLLRVILVGQPQLRTLLAHPELAQLNQRITLRWHIGPLDRDETTAYIRHRITVASRGQITNLFSPSALRYLHRRSGGVPRLINMLAHRAMLAAFAAEDRTVRLRAARRAYREVTTLPLPGRARGNSRTAWIAGGAVAATALVAVGATTLVPRLQQTSVASAPAEPEPALLASAPAPSDLVTPVPDDTPPVAETPPSEPVAALETAPPPPPDPTPAFEAQLAALAPDASARTAVAAILDAWQLQALAGDEASTPEGFDAIAEKRGLEHLALAGNAAMLRLVDVPAVLELQLPGVTGPRYAALVGMRDGAPVLVTADGVPTVVSPAIFERAWYGQAHIFFRDFENLGPNTIDGSSRGARVQRLQGLLQRTGTYGGPESGVFDPATEAAVMAFQRSRFVVADGLVGRLTRVVLYAAAGGYPRPTLTAPPAADGTS